MVLSSDGHFALSGTRQTLRLWDLSSQYVETIIAKCIDSYTARRAEEGVTIDNNPDDPVSILKAEGALGVTKQPVENLEDDTNTKIENDVLSLFDVINDGKHLYTLDNTDTINALTFSPNRFVAYIV